MLEARRVVHNVRGMSDFQAAKIERLAFPRLTLTEAANVGVGTEEPTKGRTTSQTREL